MTRATVIARRELSSFFFSPIAYVGMFLFLLAAGFSFWDDFQPGQPAVMRAIFERMVWLLVIVIPILCMGLLSQEWAATLGASVGLRTINERINQLEARLAQVHHEPISEVPAVIQFDGTGSSRVDAARAHPRG